jgi:hypothetical protein
VKESQFLKRALGLPDACLILAWSGALCAAEGQAVSNVGTWWDEENRQPIRIDAEIVIVELHALLMG